MIATEITNPNEYKLCYIQDGKAHFTTATDFTTLQTSDWDDAYDMATLHGVKDPHEILTIKFNKRNVTQTNYEKSPQCIINNNLKWLIKHSFFLKWV